MLKSGVSIKEAECPHVRNQRSWISDGARSFYSITITDTRWPLTRWPVENRPRTFKKTKIHIWTIMRLYLWIQEGGGLTTARGPLSLIVSCSRHKDKIKINMYFAIWINNIDQSRTYVHIRVMCQKYQKREFRGSHSHYRNHTYRPRVWGENRIKSPPISFCPSPKDHGRK